MLASTDRGVALALAAVLVEAITGERLRFHWLIDLDAENLAYDPNRLIDTTTDLWQLDQLMESFRGYIDQQPPWPEHLYKPFGDRCQLCITVNHTLARGQRRVQTTFHIPACSANLTALSGTPPPVGQWLIWPEPPRRESQGPLERDDCVGDRIPDDPAWIWQIPF